MIELFKRLEQIQKQARKDAEQIEQTSDKLDELNAQLLAINSNMIKGGNAHVN